MASQSVLGAQTPTVVCMYLDFIGEGVHAFLGSHTVRPLLPHTLDSVRLLGQQGSVLTCWRGPQAQGLAPGHLSPCTVLIPRTQESEPPATLPSSRAGRGCTGGGQGTSTSHRVHTPHRVHAPIIHHLVHRTRPPPRPAEPLPYQTGPRGCVCPHPSQPSERSRRRLRNNTFEALKKRYYT